jgi:glycosyltransferase involved in cell wall biosynthesis
MKIALIAPPFICIPPKQYGGTELFITQIALGLKQHGFDVVVYTNGESTIDLERRWLFAKAQWPIEGEVYDNLKDLNHSTWAVADATRDCDLIHINNLPGLPMSRVVRQPFVYTIHHPHDGRLSDFYSYFPQVNYVTISDFQREREKLPRIRTIHHGIDLRLYQVQERKQDYVCFLGRVAPVKGTHLAIEAAKKAGIALKIAGEIQPTFRAYFETKVKPHLDGERIQYVGEVNLEGKNELLGNARALLFPIQWNEPFGLVMIEAMACGTPVLALPGGSVPEIVRDGVSGYICKSAAEMAERIRGLDFAPQNVRKYAEQHFSIERALREYIELYRQVAGGRNSVAA